MGININEVRISGKLVEKLYLQLSQSGVPAIRARLVLNAEKFPDESLKLFTKEALVVEQFRHLYDGDEIVVTGNIGVHRGVYVYVASVEPYGRDDRRFSATHRMTMPPPIVGYR